VARLREAMALRERILTPADVQVWLAEVPQERDFIPVAVLDLTTAELEI
jgi:hypothetical protein